MLMLRLQSNCYAAPTHKINMRCLKCTRRAAPDSLAMGCRWWWPLRPNLPSMLRMPSILCPDYDRYSMCVLSTMLSERFTMATRLPQLVDRMAACSRPKQGVQMDSTAPPTFFDVQKFEVWRRADFT